ncbi:MAG: hypothetical protein OJF50_002451 [Nitrospira sp.]|jgi:hypothetical protein|nr:hypothetical protein [Nitrospira sp.]
MSALSNLLEFPIDFRQRFLLTCAPSPPPAPNYSQAAKDQGQANIDAAIAQGKINNPNVISPYGNQTVSWGGGFDQSGYDNAVQGWNSKVTDYTNALNQWRANGSQGPFTYDVGFGAGIDPRTKPVDRSQFNNQGVPTITQTLSPQQQQLLDKSNQAKLGLSDLAVQGTNLAKGVLGQSMDFSQLPARPGDATDTRNKVMDAMMSRINEDNDRQKGLLNSQLQAAGIPPGSKAYDDAMALQERNRTDQSNQAYLASGQEASRDFQQNSQLRRDALAEMLTQRQTPINEITALMSGSQVSNPFSMPGYAQNAQIQPAPLFGANQMTGDWNADLYNAKAAQAGNLQQGLFGLGGSLIGAGGMMLA